jgi:hypothetical protein
MKPSASACMRTRTNGRRDLKSVSKCELFRFWQDVFEPVSAPEYSPSLSPQQLQTVTSDGHSVLTVDRAQSEQD